LIDLENEFGVKRVNAALKVLGEKNPDNPTRTLAYLIGTVRRMP